MEGVGGWASLSVTMSASRFSTFIGGRNPVELNYYRTEAMAARVQVLYSGSSLTFQNSTKPQQREAICLQLSHYSKANINPKEACNDPSFYCSMIDDKICLDGLHPYYHQVQLELYICGEKAMFCDFCIFTIKGRPVHRISKGGVTF